MNLLGAGDQQVGWILARNGSRTFSRSRPASILAGVNVPGCISSARGRGSVAFLAVGARAADRARPRSALSLAARAYRLDGPCVSPCTTASDHALINDEGYYVDAGEVIAGIRPPPDLPAGQVATYLNCRSVPTPTPSILRVSSW